MNTENKIAIIGFSLNVAGANDADAFYDLISKNKTGLKRSNHEEQKMHLPKSIIQDKQFINVGGGPIDYQTFDANFFGYSPKEASLLDPQIRKALEYAYHATEHAGYAPNQLKGTTSSYVASSVNSYFNDNLRPLYENSDDSQKNQMIFLNEPDFLSTRIAYHFNWEGGAFTIKCGCSSSMVAIHEACKSLMQYECDNALAGGVAIKTRYQYGYLYEKNGILSQDGRCCPFSEDASGTVFSNGLGFVLLKRLEDAIADNDTIHAVILSSVANNDGNDKVGYMAPSISGQKKSMKTALAYADITPDHISYVEAHGTGTEIGDPIEYRGLKQIFSKCKSNSIALRTVKANIGHLDAASGVVGLIKVIQDLKHQTISPNHNFKTINPKCEFENSPFVFSKQQKKWETIRGRRIAAISSFGIGGTNAQLIVEDYQNVFERDRSSECTVLIPLSAKTKSTLSEKILALRKWIENHDANLYDISCTLLIGREHFHYRVAYIVKSKKELLKKLYNFDESEIVSSKTGKQVVFSKLLIEKPELTYSNYLDGDCFVKGNRVVKFKRQALPCYPFERRVHWVYPYENKNKKIKDVSRWFYTPYWKRREIPIPTLVTCKKTVLFFYSDLPVFKEYKSQLERLGVNVIRVVAGTEFIQNNKSSFVINPCRKEDYLSLFKTLEQYSVYVDVVIHTWSFIKGEQSFEKCMFLGLYSTLYIIKSFDECRHQTIKLLQIITENSANVSGDEIVKPVNAMLQGISQVLPKEYDDISCQLLDINKSRDPLLICQQLIDEYSRMKTVELALRGRHRFVKAYQPVRLSDTLLNPLSICANKNYLVVGGLGNFGMELGEFIGTIHKGNVFLTTRMQFPLRNKWDYWVKNKPNSPITEKIKYLLDMEKQGASIKILTADVCDISSLRKAKSYIENKFGALSGVVHAAGVVDSGMINQKTIQSLEKVFAPKVHGTKNICEVFLKKDLDFLILCSSMNSIIGGLGQLDNTAANAFIDAYAEYCLNKGYQNVIAINWGAVNEARARNYSAQAQFAKLSEEHVKNKMTKDEIFDVYKRLFSSNLGPRVVVSTIDFNQVIDNWSRVGSLKSLIGIVAQEKRKREINNKIQLPVSDMEKIIAEFWQDLLGIDIVGLDDDFFSLGGNSLIAIQFISKLTKHYPIKMHAMAIYEYPKLNKFAAYATQLFQEVKEKEALMAGENR